MYDYYIEMIPSHENEEQFQYRQDAETRMNKAVGDVLTHIGGVSCPNTLSSSL